MKTRSALAALMAALFTFSLAACGSDDAAISEDSDTATSADVSVPDADDIADASDALDGVVGEECAEWLPIWSSIVGQAFSGELTAEQQAEFDDFKDQVPEEIRDDVEVYQEFFDAIADEGMVAAAELAQSDELNQAGENISNWLDENCNPEG